jgi:hypothetical protein
MRYFQKVFFVTLGLAGIVFLAWTSRLTPLAQEGIIWLVGIGCVANVGAKVARALPWTKNGNGTEVK